MKDERGENGSSDQKKASGRSAVSASRRTIWAALTAASRIWRKNPDQLYHACSGSARETWEFPNFSRFDRVRFAARGQSPFFSFIGTIRAFFRMFYG
jgi:hypothetical protein